MHSGGGNWGTGTLPTRREIPIEEPLNVCARDISGSSPLKPSQQPQQALEWTYEVGVFPAL